MDQSQQVEKLVIQSKELGALEYRNGLIAEMVKRLSEETNTLKDRLGRLVNEKEKLPKQGRLYEQGRSDNTLQDFHAAVILRDHRRALREQVRFNNQHRRVSLEEARNINKRIGMLNSSVAATRRKLRVSFPRPKGHKVVQTFNCT